MNSRTSAEVCIKFVGGLGATEFNAAVQEIEEKRRQKACFVFDLDDVTFAPLEVLVALVFLANQLVAEKHVVRFRWVATEVLGFADRIGFFEHLAVSVTVEPNRPKGVRYAAYRDHNHQVLELTALPPGNDRQAAGIALKLLDDRLKAIFAGKASNGTFSDIWTVASEAVDNVFEHSQTRRAGLLGAQQYGLIKGKPRLQLVIADAGLGILKTLRDGNRAARGMSDQQLLATAFRDGLSRRGEKGHGCGLTRCARMAAILRGNLTVRVGRLSAKLITHGAKGPISLKVCKSNLATIDGTHITLDLYLDRLSKTR